MGLIASLVDLLTSLTGLLASFVTLAAAVLMFLTEASGPRETKNRRR